MIVKNKNCKPAKKVVAPTTMQNEIITTELVASVDTVDNPVSGSTEVQATEVAESKISESSEIDKSTQKQECLKNSAEKYLCVYKNAQQFQNAYEDYESYCDAVNRAGCVCMYEEKWNLSDGVYYGIIYDTVSYTKNSRNYFMVKVMIGNEKVFCIRAQPDFACADPIFKAAKRYFKTSFVDIGTLTGQIIKVKIVNMINGDKAYSDISALRFVNDEELNVLFTLLDADKLN